MENVRVLQAFVEEISYPEKIVEFVPPWLL